jgi:CheY-like chemotaxis protein
VLLVEDDDFLRFAVTKMLHRIGLDVDCACNGQEAVILCEKFRYPLVLMDVKMPVLNGLEATKRIREYEKKSGSRISKIVAVTGEENQPACIAAGMDDYAQKPINLPTLKALVEKWYEEPLPDKLNEETLH